ncbi:hypothetical protein F4810DRAFT_606438 [Camillea tinctor]|nr:hypothetical protein F4810DRAFT_606438 [Camillea tinctor]
MEQQSDIRPNPHHSASPPEIRREIQRASRLAGNFLQVTRELEAKTGLLNTRVDGSKKDEAKLLLQPPQAEYWFDRIHRPLEEAYLSTRAKNPETRMEAFGKTSQGPQLSKASDNSSVLSYTKKCYGTQTEDSTESWIKSLEPLSPLNKQCGSLALLSSAASPDRSSIDSDLLSISDSTELCEEFLRVESLLDSQRRVLDRIMIDYNTTVLHSRSEHPSSLSDPMPLYSVLPKKDQHAPANYMKGGKVTTELATGYLLEHHQGNSRSIPMPVRHIG